MDAHSPVGLRGDHGGAARVTPVGRLRARYLFLVAGVVGIGAACRGIGAGAVLAAAAPLYLAGGSGGSITTAAAPPQIDL